MDTFLFETVFLGFSVFVLADQSYGGDISWRNTDLALVDPKVFPISIGLIGNNGYWIGLDDRINEGRFVWNSNGAQASFVKWCSGEPNDDGGEDCGQYVTKCWNDLKCTSALTYICNKQPNINECASFPCQHGGYCLDLINEYKCHCINGYTGDNCRTNINDCRSNPCKHGGSCTDLVDDFTCSCLSGYNGTSCQIDENECEINPCNNNATCVDGIATWNCACKPGFTGNICETEIDECSSSPCIHNATCIDLINEYRCICTNESMGDNCQLWFDHCIPTPCLHEGICINHFGGFTCDCPSPWHGDICEYKEINRTEVCTDLDYTECSCHFSSIRKPTIKSYKLLSGLVGGIVGLIATILFHIAWIHHADENISTNMVNNDEHDGTSYFEVNGKSTSLASTEEEEVFVSAGPLHCNCFVDQSGYDHFQRYDPKNNRFKFHTCHKKRTISKNNRVTSAQMSC